MSSIATTARGQAPPQIQYLEGHEAPVSAVLHALEGRVVVSASADGTVKIWDKTTGEVVRTIDQFSRAVLALAVSPDGQRFAAAGLDSTIPIFDLPRQHPGGEMTGVPGVPTALAVSPDGKLLLTGDQARIVRLWDAAGNKPIRDFGGSTAEITAVVLLPERNTVLASAKDGTVRGWNLANAQAAGVVQTTAVNALAAHPKEPLIAAVGDDGIVRLFNWPPKMPPAANEPSKPIGELKTHEGPIHDAAFSPDGTRLYCAGADKTVSEWALSAPPAEGARESAELKTVRKYAADGPIKSLALSSDGKYLAAGGDDAHARLWTTADGKNVATIKTPAAITAVAVRADGRKLIVAGADNVLRNYGRVPAERAAKTPGEKAAAQAETSFALTHEGRGHTQALTALALAGDDETLFSTAADQTVKRWFAASFEPRLTLTGFKGTIYGLSFSPDGKLLAAAGAEGVVRLWDAESGALSATYDGHSTEVNAVAFNPVVKQLASCGWDGTVRLWSIEGNQPIEWNEGTTGRLQTLTYSRDGNTLLTGGSSQTWQAWSRKEQKLLRTVEGHNHAIVGLSYNPAGNRIASLDQAGQFCVWDAASGSLLYHQQLPVSAAYSLSYAPDGKELLFATHDPRILRVTLPSYAL